MGNFEFCLMTKFPGLRRGIEIPIIFCGGPDEEVLRRIIDSPVADFVGNLGRFMRRTKEPEEFSKLDELCDKIKKIVEKQREMIAKDPLSVSPARLMDLIRENIRAIDEVTSPVPLTVQLSGLRVKLPFDTFSRNIQMIEIENGVTINDIADVVPSRIRDYILIKIRPFSETNILV
jgi:putative methanogenesis marker protein 7